MTAPKGAAPAGVNPSYLLPSQVDWLLKPVEPARVAHRDGLSNMQAYDIRNHLNEVFGFGRWSEEVLTMELIFDIPVTQRNGKPGFNVSYRAQVKLTVSAPDGSPLATYTEWATGTSTMPDFKHGDAHDMAIKTAASQGLKRCATNLGNQFGLSLYAGGSLAGITRGTFVKPGTTELPEHKEQIAEETDPDMLPERDINQEPVGAAVSDPTPTDAQSSTPAPERAQEPPATASGEGPSEDEQVEVLRGELWEAIAELQKDSPEKYRQLQAMWVRTTPELPGPRALTTKSQIEQGWGVLNRARAYDPARSQLVEQAQSAFYGNK